jgi:hypothetical protein
MLPGPAAKWDSSAVASTPDWPGSLSRREAVRHSGDAERVVLGFLFEYASCGRIEDAAGFRLHVGR